jgi:putative addiction module component (TIGR02574 family)
MAALPQAPHTPEAPSALEALQAQAMQLTAAERAELAERLWSSVLAPGELDAAWHAEIEARAAQLDAGTMAPADWAEAMARLKADAA